MKTKKFRRFLSRFHQGIIYPCFNDPISCRPYKLKSRRLQLVAGFFPTFTRKYYDWCVNSRIVEVPFVFMSLNLPRGARILDFGCNSSRLSMQLANLGHKVVGVDLLDYEFTHPNFEFFKGDFLNNDFEAESFDGVVAVSSVEHAGLGAYDEENGDEDGDILVVNEITRLLRSEGKFIITVPFGAKANRRSYRIYDRERLGELLRDYKIERECYYQCTAKKWWNEVSAVELEQFTYEDDFVSGVALASCIKK